jgi:hypothetical protein
MLTFAVNIAIEINPTKNFVGKSPRNKEINIL